MNQTDPLDDRQPESPRPEWAADGLPYGDALLRSGPAVVSPDGVIESEEVVRPKLLASPTMPSKQEIAEHETSHIPQRNWCPDCNAGKMIAAPHGKRPDTPEKKDLHHRD